MNKYLISQTTKYIIKPSAFTPNAFVIDCYHKKLLICNNIRVAFLNYLLTGKPYMGYRKKYLDEWIKTRERVKETDAEFVFERQKFSITKDMAREVVIICALLKT